MSTRISFSIAVSLVVVIAFCAFNGTTSQTEGAQRAIKRWEHLAMTQNGPNVSGNVEATTKIVQLGNEGWELVSVSTVVKDGSTIKTVFFFKRPK